MPVYGTLARQGSMHHGQGCAQWGYASLQGLQWHFKDANAWSSLGDSSTVGLIRMSARGPRTWDLVLVGCKADSRLQVFHGEKELFMSKHTDFIDADTVSQKCTVMSISEFMVLTPHFVTDSTPTHLFCSCALHICMMVPVWQGGRRSLCLWDLEIARVVVSQCRGIHEVHSPVLQALDTVDDDEFYTRFSYEVFSLCHRCILHQTH